MSGPADFFYTREHVWIELLDPLKVRIGVTPYAVEKLGEIISIELPVPGTPTKSGRPIGTLESAKTISDLYCPVSGVVLEVNDPPFHRLSKEWLVLVELDQPCHPSDWMSSFEYASYTKEESR
ncbi:glycine cleavage system protein H [Ammoniphilus sp. YIM 78166]|uniref:glycine cleavage system protein H n=1 Tax=Ammoniphilus sp. YIM 78166 TaxID=1644106 RepID=UPI00106F3798|nr:glycine cleavage system protein H [Ammoniphilus sp. YIM 78166]